MFELQVADVFSIRNVFAVYGKYKGRIKPGTVKDECDNEYEFAIPFCKRLEFRDDEMELQLMGPNIDVGRLALLKGQKLVQDN